MTKPPYFFSRPHLIEIAAHKFLRRLCSAILILGALIGLDGQTAAPVLAASGDCVNNAGTLTCTYTYTGAAQSWTVPAGVTQATFVVDGAQGGTGQLIGGTQGTGGLGARAQATFTVSAGQIYQLMVGGTGSVTAGGFNGGGAGGTSARPFNGAGGGGASDVRSGTCATSLSCALADRLIIAGGGGGGAAVGGNGGSGGQLGGNGGTSIGGTAGTGGTAASGGTGGTRANGGSTAGAAGQLGQGGDGGFANCGCGGAGGGGGGLYGGGGGGYEGGGGGGSSFGPAGTTFQSGAHSGNGQIAVIYTPPDNTGPVAHPTLSPLANAEGWNNTNVTVNWNWTDDLTGIVNGPCEPSTASNGEGAQTLTAFCADEAGNLSQASYTVKVDRAQPLIRSTISPTANGFGWNNSAVSVSFTCQEQGSGSGLADNTVGGNQIFSSEGANFTATSTGTCTDIADNVATPITVGPIKIDLTKPTISAAATTQPNANGWYSSNVTVRFTCSDNLSGAVSCPADQTLSSEGTALSSTAQTVSDRAQNTSAASNIVTVKIDKTAPNVTVTGVTEGATYAFGSVPTASCSTSDALSGVATQATLTVTGGNPNGSGNLTATCSPATDLAGNSAAEVSVSYTVEPPPTATPTDTPVPPTATPTLIPTNTPVPPTATATPATGSLLGSCGPYTVYQQGKVYTAAGWSGAIKVGTSGNNTLIGTNGPDLILGLRGNDLLRGNGGDDLLCGGDGVDLLQGLAGNDYLDGGAGNDVLNGGTGDYDELLGGASNDVLLDPDGVRNAAGGPGNDTFTLTLRNGWRDANGQAHFAALSGGYGNDIVTLKLINQVPFLVELTGDERDNPTSPLEGNTDRLTLAGVINPASTIIKFEQTLGVSATADVQILGEESGAEFLTEPVGEDGLVLDNTIFLPLVSR